MLGGITCFYKITCLAVFRFLFACLIIFSFVSKQLQRNRDGFLASSVWAACQQNIEHCRRVIDVCMCVCLAGRLVLLACYTLSVVPALPDVD
jgi:hypothetical protein